MIDGTFKYWVLWRTDGAFESQDKIRMKDKKNRFFSYHPSLNIGKKSKL